MCRAVLSFWQLWSEFSFSYIARGGKISTRYFFLLLEVEFPYGALSPFVGLMIDRSVCGCMYSLSSLFFLFLYETSLPFPLISNGRTCGVMRGCYRLSVATKLLYLIDTHRLEHLWLPAPAFCSLFQRTMQRVSRSETIKTKDCDEPTDAPTGRIKLSVDVAAFEASFFRRDNSKGVDI